MPSRAQSASGMSSKMGSGLLSTRTETGARDLTTLPGRQPVCWAFPEELYARGRPFVSTGDDGLDAPARELRSPAARTENATAENTSSGSTTRRLLYEVFVGGLCVYSGGMPPTCDSYGPPESGQRYAEPGCPQDRTPKPDALAVPS